MSPLAQALAASPELFPAALDVRSSIVTLWRLSRADYQLAAFLDGRIAAGKPSRQLLFAELEAAVKETELGENCDFIFHIGHVGSTLVSRLLGRHPALLSWREPDILRTLATIREKVRRDAYMPPLLKLWPRTYEPEARALVKTTSFVSEIAGELLARPFAPRALMIGVTPETYLETILGGEHAPSEARSLAPFRLARINTCLSTDWQLENLGMGEIAALGWACETLCLAKAAQTVKHRVFILDFEKFLVDPRAVLCSALVHLGLDPAQSEIDQMFSGSETRSYSKAPEHAYDAATRRAVLAGARARNPGEIRRGMAWLERAAAEHPMIAGALTFFD